MSAVIKSAPRSVPGQRLDQAAICLSAACLAHCLLIPVVLVVAPWLSLGVLGEEWFHLTMIVLIIPLSLIAFRTGLRQHGQRRVFALGLAGLALIALAAVLEATHWVSHTWAAVVTSAGGVLLIVAHWRNLKPRVCSNLSSRSMR